MLEHALQHRMMKALPRGTLACYAVIALLALWSTGVAGIRRGDEIHHDAADGKFYGFSDGIITMFEPDTGASVNITTDNEGRPFADAAGVPLVWADSIYMESADQTRKYVFVNAYNAVQQTESYVYVIDTTTDTVVSRIPSGPRPVHIYAIPETEEVWTHPDGLGTFEVIHIGDPTRMAFTGIRALDSLGAHGKLIVHPDLLDNETPVGYATNTMERFFFEIGLEAKTLLQAYSYAADEAARIPANSTLCRGLHGIAYSPINKHIYAECTNGGGLLEWDTVTKKTIQRWDEQGGHIFLTRNERFLSSTNRLASKSFIFEVGQPGQPSTLRYTIDVAGNPAYPAFYPKGGVSSTNIEDYRLFWPMCNIVNKALLQRVAQLNQQGAAIDVTAAEYLTAPGDCNYTGPEAGTNRLLVRARDCGSCVATMTSDDPNDWDLTASGMQYIDLADVLLGNETDASFAPGHAMKALIANTSTANECSFGSTWRTCIRGSVHIVVAAQFPSNSFLVITGEDAQVIQTIPTGANPKSAVFVPQTASAAPAASSPSTASVGSAGTTTRSSWTVLGLAGLAAMALSGVLLG